MQKKRLLADYPLKADAQILEKAAKDVPIQEKSFWRTRERYQYDIHINCQIKEGILMAGIYFTRDLRLGSVKPAFELLIDREKEVYATWDSVCNKWRNAALNRLNWPEYFPMYHCSISDENSRRIKSYLNVPQDGAIGLLSFQQSILAKRLKERHRKETAPWDKEMEKIRPLPKDWDIWAARYGIQQHYLFYDYSRKKRQKGYCTWCRRMVPITGKPKHNQIGKCSRCHHTVQFKARGRAGRFHTEAETAYLLQSCGKKVVLRQFKLKCWYRPGQYETPYYSFFEERRVFYDQDWNADEYYFGEYKKTESRWIKGVKTYNWFSWNSEDAYRDYRGMLYRRNLPGFKMNHVGQTGITAMSRCDLKIRPDLYMEKWKGFRDLEELSKAGLFGLVRDVLDGKSLEMIPEKSLAKSLGIDRDRLRWIKERQAGILALQWLKYEKQNRIHLSDAMILWFQKHNIRHEDLLFILDRMTEEEIYNYLNKQCRISERAPKEMISTWEDYLLMAKVQKWDVTLEIFYKPKNLIASHNKLVQMLGGADMAQRIQCLEAKYPNVSSICASIKEKYRFEDKEYLIVVPDGIRDIVVEGKKLDLCISWSDTYFDRIERRETYFAFLRKKKSPDTPFYMIEIEPGGSIRQKRTHGDTQTPELEDAKPFLKKWQRHILKSLTEEDKRLAQTSARLRAEEFAELRRKQSKIWNGNLRGQLLADVLEADLMEAALCSETTEDFSENNAAFYSEAA